MSAVHILPCLFGFFAPAGSTSHLHPLLTMHYRSVLSVLGQAGRGVHEYNQSQTAATTHVLIGEGVCLGLVANWLCALAAGKDPWWKERSPEGETQPLLAHHGTIASGAATQAASEATKITGQLDPATIALMRTNGNLIANDGDSCSKGVGYILDWQVIVDSVLNKTSRYYILGIRDEHRGHAIGLCRMPTREVRAFDPNVGDFELMGNEGVARFLLALRTVVYGRNMHANFHLWAFN